MSRGRAARATAWYTAIVFRIPKLTTRRLVLRPYRERDRDAFERLHRDPQAREHLGGALSAAHARSLFDRLVDDDEVEPGEERWAITLVDDGTYIGHAFFTPRHESGPDGEAEIEVGFMLCPEYWGLGYGTELVRRLVEYALRRAQYPALVATVDAGHEASLRVLEQAGMERERTEEDAHGAYTVLAVRR
ncbi:MAG: GNAT family N-acetyltransferase [Polyangiales bacterium]